GIEDGLPYTAGNLLIVGIAVLSGEALVKAVLQSRTAVILVDKTDRSPTQVCERHVAHVDFFENRPAAKASFPQYRPAHHQLLLLVIHLAAIENNVLLARVARIDQHSLVFAFRAILEKSSQMPRQRIHAAFEHFILRNGGIERNLIKGKRGG